MHKEREFRICVLFMALICLLSAGAAHSEETLFRLGSDGSVTVSGEVTLRGTYENWFEPVAPATDNDYGYVFTRTRLGVALRHPYIGAFVQAQDVHMWELPERAVAPAPQGPAGIGATYFLHAGSGSSNSLIIRQAYLDFPKVFANGLSARAGRFDYADGQEVKYDNQKVNWMKSTRLSDRLIGSFDWSSFNRSFDGAQITYSAPAFSLHAMASHPTQGGFESDAHKTIPEIDLAAVTGTIKYNGWLKNTEGRVFYYYYNDARNITNTPGQSGLEEGNIRIHTYGTHWLGTGTVKPGVFDLLFWGALQDGTWGGVSHSAWAAAIEGGFQFTGAPWKPWIRGGYFVSTGDSDPNDGEHETFYQMLPTARKYALFPFYNLMNNEDLFVQAILRPKNSITIRTDLHKLDLRESGDLWYNGAGPTRRSGTIFGYTGRPSGGFTDLATVFEIAPSFTFSRNFSANLYFGHAWGGKVVKSIYSADSGGDFFLVEFKAQI